MEKTQQSFCLKPLPLEALDDLHCPLSKTTRTHTEKKTMKLLKNCDFFCEKFKSSVELDEFAQFAKSAVTYETHEYGTILLNEDNYIEKFYLLVEGQVEKIRQKPQPKNVPLSCDLNSSQSNSNFEGSPMRLRRSRASIKIEESSFSPKRPSVKIEESSFSPKRPSRMSFLGQIQKDTAPSLPAIKRPFRTSLFVNTVRSPMTMDTTTDLESPGSKKTSSPMSCHKSSMSSINDPEGFTPLNQEEQELMEFVCKDDVELQKRYYCEENLRAIKVKTYHSGDFLGENPAIVTLQKSSSMLVVSSKKARFLTFSRDNLNTILNIMENKTQEKLKVFLDLFPVINLKLVKRFSSYFQQKYYQVNETIYTQDENTKDLYFLSSGEIKLLKTSSNQKQEIPIVTVMSDQFFGEEALLDRETRQETAVANAPNTLVYVLSGDSYDLFKTSFHNFFDVLTPLAQEKFSWRKTKAAELFDSERFSPRTIYFPPKKNLSPTSQKLNRSTEKRKSSFFKRNSFLSDTPPISSCEVSKTSEDSPTTRVTEQYKSQFSRTIVVCKNGNEPHPFDLKKSPSSSQKNASPALDFEDFNIKRELSVGKKKVYSSFSRNCSPRKNEVEKDPILIQYASAENIHTSPLFNNAKKAMHKAGRKSRNYIPTFMPVKNFNLTDNEVDLSSLQGNAFEEPVKRFSTYRDTDSNAVKMLIRRIKIH